MWLLVGLHETVEAGHDDLSAVRITKLNPSLHVIDGLSRRDKMYTRAEDMDRSICEKCGLEFERAHDEVLVKSCALNKTRTKVLPKRNHGVFDEVVERERD